MTDPPSNSFAPDRDGLVGHDLRLHSQAICRGRIDWCNAALEVLHSQHKPAFCLSYATLTSIETAGIYIPARRLPLNFPMAACPRQLQYGCHERRPDSCAAVLSLNI